MVLMVQLELLVLQVTPVPALAAVEMHQRIGLED
jgi:hypothetical protein